MAASLTSTDLTLDNTSGASIPGTPSAGQTVIYPKDDKLLYYKDDAGVERLVNVTATIAGIGDGQTWQNVTASRAAGTTYTNSTGKPIMMNVHDNSSGGVLVVGGVTQNRATNNLFYTAIVPNGATYSFSLAFTHWNELR